MKSSASHFFLIICCVVTCCIDQQMHATAINNLVFLGGSCNPTTWRSEVAIPYLKQVQVQFYNPQVDQWRPELIDQENIAKHNAGVLLFVIDNQTRAVSALIELAELAASNRVLVCVLKNFIQPNTRFCGQLISEGEYQELRHAQAVVKRLMERRGVPVFSELKDALLYTSELIKRQLSTDELIRQFSAAYLAGLLKPPTKLVRLREIFRSLDIGNTGEIRMYDVQYAYQLITNCMIDEQTIRTVIFYQLRCSDNYVISENNSDLRLNFEQFCCLLAIHEHQRKVGACTTISHPPGVQSNGKLRPLQWIFDWFSGVPNRSDCDLHLNLTNSSNVYMKSAKSNDQLDGVSSRSRTPVQRLDSGVYCNQTNTTPPQIINAHQNSNHNSSLSLYNSNDAKLVTGGHHSDYESNELEEVTARHLYPFQAECRDVYLGGSGLPSRWREELAIPILRYYFFLLLFKKQKKVCVCVFNQKI